jgi:hypothetical protein
MKNKLSKKDILIIILSGISLVMLLLIIFLSRKKDQMISETLQNNSEISTDAAIASIGSTTTDYLEISEVSADKWLEIHNVGNEDLDISNIQVLVSGKKVASVQDGTVIKKDDYYVIDLSSNPGAGSRNVLTIVDANDDIIRSFIVPKLDASKSYGLADTENNIWGYITESKGKANSNKDITYIEEGGIGISALGGFYSSSFELELKCKDGEKIYYTTDGTKPTTDSQLYEDTISIINKSGTKFVYARKALYNRLVTDYMPSSIDAGMLVRAIKVNSAGETTGEINEAYFIGLTKDSDYLDLPVISITTEPENLFDYEKGIYVPGRVKEDALIQGLTSDYYANYYHGWRKDAKIEYYEPNKDKTFETTAKIAIDTEYYSASRQKGFLIEIKNDDYLQYKGSSVIDYISSDNQLRLTHNFEDNTIKVRNLLANKLLEESDMGAQICKPCVLFLEGEYWGLYVIRQYQDENYIRQTYDVGSEELITHSGTDYNEQFQEFYTFATENNMANSQNYEQLKEMMDVDNFIDYICVNIFLGNSNFSPEQGTAWRTVSTGGRGVKDGRWRFILGDLSETMYLSSTETPTIDTYLQLTVQSDILFQSLLMNEEFCNKLETRMKSIISTYFDPDKASSELDESVSYIKKPAISSFKRFFSNLTESSYSDGVERIREFFVERPEFAIKYTHEIAEKGGDLENAREIIRKKLEKEAASAAAAGAQVITEENTEEGEENETAENAEDGGNTENGENTENETENPEENVNG